MAPYYFLAGTVLAEVKYSWKPEIAEAVAVILVPLFHNCSGTPPHDL